LIKLICSISAIPRSTFVVLSQADFPPIFDRNGTQPTLIDASSVTNKQQQPSIDIELNDKLDSNEIIFQFLAISRFV
jgi:hypothetical protein